MSVGSSGEARILCADILGLARATDTDLIADVIAQLGWADTGEWLVGAVAVIAALMETLAQHADVPVEEVYERMQSLARRDR